MLEEICLPIRDELAEVEKVIEACTVSSVPLATDVARYALEGGGKRIRPTLFLLASHIVGAPRQELASVAAAVELVHTASLLHDDVVDDATMRRARPTAHQRWGNCVGILVGDFLLSCATSLLIETPCQRIFGSIAKAVREVSEGELLEITHNNDVELDKKTYMRIVELKTAALFTACGSAAAMLAEIPEKYTQALVSYAFELGISFQLADDVLDYTCQNSLSGKNPGVDLREGKLTLPLIVALEKANSDEKKQIRNALLSSHLDDATFESIVAIINKRHGIVITKECAREHIDKAKSCLAVFKPSIERDSLLSLADYVIERNG